MELKIAEHFTVDPTYIITERSAIIGQSGSGKSYLVSVICEELAANNLGFVVIDTEGEYHGLAKFGDIKLIDDIKNISADEENIRRIIERSQKIVLDVSESDLKTVNTFLESLYRVVTELFREGPHKQIPFLLIVEEADIYIPQRGRGLEILQLISRRGRKRGLGLLLATQRPALVNKNVLSQCNNVFIGKLTLKNDLDSVRIFFSSMDDAKQLTSLEPGSFYVQGAIADPTFIKIRTRVTPHGGSTPRIKSCGPAGSSLLGTDEGRFSGIDLTDQTAKISRAIKSTKVGRRITYIDFNESQVLNSIVSHRRKRYKFFGKYEAIASVKIVMLPIFEVHIRQIKRGILSNKFDDYAILIDGATGDILNPRGDAKRSKNLRYLFDLNPHQLRIFDFILHNKDVTITKLRSELPLRGLKSGLKKLEDLHLIAMQDDCYLPLHHITYPKSLKTQCIKELPLKEGMAPDILKPRVSSAHVRGLVRGLYQGCEVMDTSIIYAPLIEVTYQDVGIKRLLRLNALSAKTQQIA